MVSDMGNWYQGVWKWNLVWRRAIRDSEKPMVSNLLDLISPFFLNADSNDKWVWNGKASGGFSVKNIYEAIEKHRLPSTTNPNSRTGTFKIIWKSTAPFKAQVHGWRLIRNRLPSFDNLRKWLDLSGADGSCCFCRLADESCRHLFFECDKVRFIWDHLISWIGCHWVAPNTPNDHLQSFSFLLGGGSISKFLSGLWICTVWVWWNWRNAITFRKENWNIRRILEEIKSRFWSWNIARGKINHNFSFAQWCTLPLLLHGRDA